MILLGFQEPKLMYGGFGSIFASDDLTSRLSAYERGADCKDGINAAALNSNLSLFCHL